MSAQVDVLAVMDRQLRDRAERANRYRKNAEKSARKSGEPQITADRMAAYTDLQLVELREARDAVAALIAERDALREALSQKVNDAEQRAFEDWLESKSPSGDHEEVQWKWMGSHEYRDFIDEWREQIDALPTGESA